MLMDAAKLSAMIRSKKKKMMEDPEVVNSNPAPEMNAIDVFSKEQDARIQETIGSPEKINADDKYNEGYQGVGLSEDEKARMPRLRKYLDMLDMGM